MIPLRVDVLLDRIRRDAILPPPHWTIHPPSALPSALNTWIQREARQESEFDALRLREGVLRSTPPHKVLYATCPHGRLVVYLEKHDSADLPWELWGRILRLYDEGRPFTIYLLASSTPRRFPPPLKPIQPQHINGGYTYPCRTDTIVIYRAEDATRVLLHELQHACCLDHHEQGVDNVEAETEAWAEVLYTAFLAKGDPGRWRQIWARQWAWIRRQNERIKRHTTHMGHDPLHNRVFPWRYTLGKEDILRSWFPSALLPTVSNSSRASITLPDPTSLRLTVPPTADQKRDQAIRSASTFL